MINLLVVVGMCFCGVVGVFVGIFGLIVGLMLVVVVFGVLYVKM